MPRRKSSYIGQALVEAAEGPDPAIWADVTAPCANTAEAIKALAKAAAQGHIEEDAMLRVVAVTRSCGRALVDPNPKATIKWEE